MSRAWKGGSTRAWRKIRAAVLLRDGNRCQIKLPGCTTIAQCVHHMIGRSVSGDDPKFLQAACTWCNLKVGSPSDRGLDPEPRPNPWW